MGYLMPQMRVFLLAGSVITFFFVVKFIQKSRVRIEDTMFWVILCVALVLISVFPQIPYLFAKLLNISSPANGVFMILIFILLVNQFYMTLKVSRLQIKLTDLVQRVAIDKKENEDKNR